MKGSRIGLRTSQALRALIESYGDLSAASQALMLIGSAALGGNISSLAADLLWLEQQRLSPDMKAKLRLLFNELFNNSLNTLPPATVVDRDATASDHSSAEEAVDPFLVGLVEV